MNFLKILFLLLWVVCTAVFVLVFLTPLEFTSKYLLFTTFLIAFNGIFILRFLLTSFISLKWNKVVFGFILSLTLLFSFYFFPGLNPSWETKEVLFYNRSDSSIVILKQQVETKGGFIEQRIIKVTPVPPFFNWVTEVKTIVNLDETQWRSVNAGR